MEVDIGVDIESHFVVGIAVDMDFPSLP